MAGAYPSVISSILADWIAPAREFQIDTCSSGCKCSNKKSYSGTKIRLSLNQTEIELDPTKFKSPVNGFAKGDCFIVLTGTVDVDVGEGWIGNCCK